MRPPGDGDVGLEEVAALAIGNVAAADHEVGVEVMAIHPRFKLC